MSPSGKAPGFDPGMRRFESCHPSHTCTDLRALIQKVEPIKGKVELANLMLFSGGANPALSERVADQLRVRLGRADVGRFSDGEVMVEIHENVRGQDVFLLQSTCAPTNDSLMELLIMADAIKRGSATRVTAVIPYFGYARQDRRPRSARVAISAKVVADMISVVGVDRVLTGGSARGSDPGLFQHRGGQCLRFAGAGRSHRRAAVRESRWWFLRTLVAWSGRGRSPSS